MPHQPLIACRDCDLVQREPATAPGLAAKCGRCGAVLFRCEHGSLDRTLALTIGAVILFVLANVFPLVGLELKGRHNVVTLFGAVQALWVQGMSAVAALVFLTTIVFPAAELAAITYMLLPLKMGRRPTRLATVFRLVETVRPWGMVEVFVLGVLVSLVKLAHIAVVVPGVALWSFGALIVLLAAEATSLDSRDLWLRVGSAVGRARHGALDSGTPGATG
jgi:paraquat-inducible protein A